MNVFREYVTSTAFKLSLSKVQIECLCQIDQLGHSWMWLSTFNALAGKGLVERTASPSGTEHPAGVTVALTEAGRAVIPLLRLAGLYVDFSIPPSEPIPEIEIHIRRKGEPEVQE